MNIYNLYCDNLLNNLIKVMNIQTSYLPSPSVVWLLATSVDNDHNDCIDLLISAIVSVFWRITQLSLLHTI